MRDTSETNTKVLSRELFLGVVTLKRLYLKIIICATRTLFSGTVTYDLGDEYEFIWYPFFLVKLYSRITGKTTIMQVSDYW